MDTLLRVSAVAALIAEPARARMLSALVNDESMTVTELALRGRVTVQTASGHLAMMRDGGLVTPHKRGRHRYYRLASQAVAEAIEALEVLAADRTHPGWRARLSNEPLRIARTCYDHLAGRLGVAMTEVMVQRRHLLPYGKDFCITLAGERFLRRLGVDMENAKASRRSFARQCLDWSERRPHLAGSLGAAFASRCFELGWFRRTPRSRVLVITDKGRAALRDVFALTL
jgi:DNA-binding transcriptional ArsR family regulator